MAYKILYASAKIPKSLQRKRRFILLTVGFFALFVLTVNLMLPSQMALLREILLGQADVETLLQELRQGTTIGEAVAAFCQGVLDGR